MLSTEISTLLRDQDENITQIEIAMHINNFTAEFESMLNESFREFERKPNPGIFYLYFKPVSRVKRDNIIDFQFDFEKVPPLVNDEVSSVKATEDTFTPDITEPIDTPSSLEKSSFVYNAAKQKTFKSFTPGQLSFSYDEIETPPTTERPFYSPYSIKLSMYLIIIGALIIVILGVIISFCFCYGCRC